METREEKRSPSKVRVTIDYLKACQKAKAAGQLTSYTTDAHWLINMAINRRAGWPDDPTLSRGSAMPVNGKYPVRYAGDNYNHLKLRAREINTPRLIVREQSLGEWRDFLMARIPDRITKNGEE